MVFGCITYRLMPRYTYARFEEVVPESYESFASSVVIRWVLVG